MENTRKSRILAAVMSLGMIPCIFTGCGTDPTADYKAEVEKLANVSNLENGTVRLNVSLDLADTDEVLSLDSLMSMSDYADCDVNFGVIASWSCDASSASISLDNENLFTVSGDTDKLYIDLTKIGEALNSTDQDTELPQMISGLFTVVEFDTDEINDLLASSLEEEDSIKVDSLNENFIATFTDEAFIESIKNLGDKAVKIDNGVEITDITVDDIETIGKALKDSAEKHDLESVTSLLDEYGSVSEVSEYDADTESTEDTESDIPKVTYRLTYDSKSLSQKHTLEFIKENDDKLTLVFEINDTNEGFIDLSDSAKTFKDITGYSLSEFVESISSLFSMDYDDAEYDIDDFDYDTNGFDDFDSNYEFNVEDFEYDDSLESN